MNGKKTVLILVPIVVVIALVASYYLFFAGGEAEKKYSVGDYLEYDIEATTLLGEMSGFWRFEVMEVTEEGYKVSITAEDLPFIQPKSKTYGIDETIGPELMENMEFVEDITLPTVLGAKKLTHYYIEEETEEGTVETDSYIDEETDLVFIVYRNEPGISMKVELAKTNIKWLG